MSVLRACFVSPWHASTSECFTSGSALPVLKVSSVCCDHHHHHHTATSPSVPNNASAAKATAGGTGTSVFVERAALKTCSRLYHKSASVLARLLARVRFVTAMLFCACRICVSHALTSQGTNASARVATLREVATCFVASNVPPHTALRCLNSMAASRSHPYVRCRGL